LAYWHSLFIHEYMFETQTTTETEPPSSEVMPIIVRTATAADAKYAFFIAAEMKASAIARGTGIANRSPESLMEKMESGHAVIALSLDGTWAGFSYIESWENGAFVSNSGMIVNPAFRERGVAKAIKKAIFQLSRTLYPKAKVFSITTGAAIMKLNTALGFEPVTYDQITRDNRFWEKCRQCVNFSLLEKMGYNNCLCTAMLFQPTS
jgi:GNAT superfamily N-acetyltransferase